MENEETEFKSLFAKYLVWKNSQKSQTDDYEYERSLIEFTRSCLTKSGKKGFRQSDYLQELGCYVGQLLPFDEGSICLHELSGISLTDQQTERLTHHYGEVLRELKKKIPLANKLMKLTKNATMP